jgi:putative membrane protein
MIMRKSILISLLCLGGMAAKAQIPQPDPDTTARHFIIVASIGNLQEVSAGQQAVRKAKREDVRMFGQMMVKDHGMAEQQLLTLAKNKGYDIPAAATGGVQPDINLKNAGDDFDGLYIHAMVTGHGSTVQMFENYATVGKDADVRDFARRMLPTLKRHLAEIKAIEENQRVRNAK